MTDPDATIRSIGRSQHGLVTRRQLRAAGVAADVVYRRIAAGVLERLSTEVMRVGGSPATERSDLLAAVLDAGRGAVASHESAAALWGMDGFSLSPAHVTGRRCRPRRSSAQLGVVAQPLDLSPVHLSEVDHIPTTTPERTLFDLAGRPLREAKVAWLVDWCLARRLVTVQRLDATVTALAKRGRPGSAVMRRVVAARVADPVPFESGLERRFLELSRQVWGLTFARQVDIGRGESIGSVGSTSSTSTRGSSSRWGTRCTTGH